MIAVTGEPRSGTSLTMILCQALGLSLAGEQYIGDDSSSNPDGVWEIPRIARNGLSKDMYDGKTSLCPKITEDCIKLMSYALTSSAPSLFDKIIVCVRNPVEVVQSQRLCGYEPTNGELSLDYTQNMIVLLKWLGDCEKSFHVVDYNDMIKSPIWNITGLSSFLGAQSTNEELTKIARLVKPEYYRNRGGE